MKRVVWEHVFAGLAALAGCAAVISACAHDDSTLFVRSVLAPQLVSNGNVCVFSSDPGQPYLSSGVLDLDFRHDYEATYLVGNQIVPKGNPAQSRSETSFVTMKGAIVRITNAGGQQLRTFTRDLAATIPPAVGGTPSYSSMSVLTIDHTTVEDPNVIAAGSPDTVRLVTYVRFFGDTLGGQYVESDEYEFPVDVCFGCLVQFAPQDMATGVADGGIPFRAPNCIGNVTTGSTSTLPVPCIRGQDIPVDCSQCQDVPACHGAYAAGGP